MISVKNKIVAFAENFSAGVRAVFSAPAYAFNFA